VPEDSAEFHNQELTLIDAAIEGFGADRGFVVVREAAGFRAPVARYYKSEALAEAEQEVSSSIAAAAA